ncbi:MAG: flavodoxin reductase [Chitinophagaceae bacterium]
MENQIITIKSLVNITHDVVQFTTDKPSNVTFVPGQAAEIAVNKEGWKDEKRPFTFTSLPDDDSLEFTIKIYPSHNGVTRQLSECQVNDELILHEVFGTITFKNQGIFIAGGAGVTPFISIFKQLEKLHQIGNNRLIFANKSKADIILEAYFGKILGSNFINILSDETTPDYAHGRITRDFLSSYIEGQEQMFYLCGPEAMMNAVEEQLISLQVNPDLIVKEQF